MIREGAGGRGSEVQPSVTLRIWDKRRHKEVKPLGEVKFRRDPRFQQAMVDLPLYLWLRKLVRSGCPPLPSRPGQSSGSGQAVPGILCDGRRRRQRHSGAAPAIRTELLTVLRAPPTTTTPGQSVPRQARRT